MTGPGAFWVALGALLLSAFFSTLHMSLRAAPRGALADLAQRRSPRAAARIDRILDDADAHLLAINLPRILCTLIVAVESVFWIVSFRSAEHGNPDAPPSALELTLGLGMASLFIWLVGFAVPHSIAKHAGERITVAFAPLLRAAHALVRPVGPIVRFLDEIVRRLAGEDDETENEAREAELLSVVEEGRQEGQFDETERDMIEAVVEFRTTTVEQIMTPRTEIDALECTDDLAEVKAYVRDRGHSRVPVYEDDLDHILGVLYAKDLLRWMASEAAERGEPFSLRAILRPALFVPETKTVRQLMRELLEKKVHIAIVADEYGGTAGLVTIEDIVEEIFGDIQDEYETAEDEAPEVVILEGAAEIDGRVHVADANDELEPLGIELPESEDYDTVGGLVTVTLGRIPDEGERLRHDGVVITVLQAEPTRVSRVRVELADETAPADATVPPEDERPHADSRATTDDA